MHLKEGASTEGRKCIPVFGGHGGMSAALSTRIHVAVASGVSRLDPVGKIIKAQPDVGDDSVAAFSREPVPPIFVVL